MNVNSLKAYYKNLKTFPELRFETFRTICLLKKSKRLYPCIYGVALYLDLPVNKISGRFTELKREGLIEHYTDVIINNNNHGCYEKTDIEKPLDVQHVNNWKKKYLELKVKYEILSKRYRDLEFYGGRL